MSPVYLQYSTTDASITDTTLLHILQFYQCLHTVVPLPPGWSLSNMSVSAAGCKGNQGPPGETNLITSKGPRGQQGPPGLTGSPGPRGETHALTLDLQFKQCFCESVYGLRNSFLRDTMFYK